MRRGGDATAPLPAFARADLSFPTVSSLKIFNNGHSVQLQWDEEVAGTGRASIAVDAEGGWGTTPSEPGRALRLPLKPLQLHHHSSAEHAVDGNLSPVEVRRTFA